MWSALPTEILESGLYDGTVKSALLPAYMEALQRRVAKKGWTDEQLTAIQVCVATPNLCT
jgi:hypothetical protein